MFQIKSNKFALLVIITSLFAVTALGQLSQPQLDSVVKKYSKALQNRGIDTVCIYNEYCIGCLFNPVNNINLCDGNFSSLPTYIFWKEKGKTFVTRKDICFDYSTQVISIDSFWQYYSANKQKIKKEELKIPQYIETVNGKRITRSLNIDHSIYFQLTVITGSESVSKNINSFYFTKELGVNEEKNINYEFNMLTSLNRLHQILQGIIRQESVKQKFTRSLR